MQRMYRMKNVKYLVSASPDTVIHIGWSSTLDLNLILHRLVCKTKGNSNHDNVFCFSDCFVCGRTGGWW